MRIDKGNLMDRLRSKQINPPIECNQDRLYWKRLFFSSEQLIWIEDQPDLWVEMITAPRGQEYDGSSKRERIQVNQISEFLDNHPLENIWRSWDVWRSNDGKNHIGCIPFWIDIDDETENLANSYNLVLEIIDYFLNNSRVVKTENNLRINFSGRKGFHIYIKPEEVMDGEKVRAELISFIREKLKLPGEPWDNRIWQSTVIDVFHDAIRQVGSIHSWINSDGKLISRRTHEYSIEQFVHSKVKDIIDLSEDNIPH